MKPRSQSDPAVMLGLVMTLFLILVGVGIGLAIGSVIGLLS